MTGGDDPRQPPLATGWSNQEGRAEQRRKLLTRAQRWTESERLAIANAFFEELLTHYPLIRRHVGAAEVPSLANQFSGTLGRFLNLDDDRKRLGVEALRLGATLNQSGFGAVEYQMCATVLAHVLAEFQDDVPYQQARSIWQADLGTIVEVMLVVGATGIG